MFIHTENKLYDYVFYGYNYNYAICTDVCVSSLRDFWLYPLMLLEHESLRPQIGALPRELCSEFACGVGFIWGVSALGRTPIVFRPVVG